MEGGAGLQGDSTVAFCGDGGFDGGRDGSTNGTGRIVFLQDSDRLRSTSLRECATPGDWPPTNDRGRVGRSSPSPA
jgi:hypothetical protein